MTGVKEAQAPGSTGTEPPEGKGPAGEWTAMGPAETEIARAQVAAAVRLRGSSAVKGAPQRYVGLVTRLLGFAIDAAIVNLVAAFTWAIVALTINALGIPDGVANVILLIMAGVYVVWATAYFVSFWSSTGQTPGARAMEFRVVDEDDGRPITARRAFLRFIGMILGAIPFFAGYIVGLFNARCRCFLDVISDSVVIDAPVYTVADRRRLARDAAINKYKPRYSSAEQQLDGVAGSAHKPSAKAGKEKGSPDAG